MQTCLATESLARQHLGTRQRTDRSQPCAVVGGNLVSLMGLASCCLRHVDGRSPPSRGAQTERRKVGTPPSHAARNADSGLPSPLPLSAKPHHNGSHPQHSIRLKPPGASGPTSECRTARGNAGQDAILVCSAKPSRMLCSKMPIWRNQMDGSFSAPRTRPKHTPPVSYLTNEDGAGRYGCPLLHGFRRTSSTMSRK